MIMKKWIWITLVSVFFATTALFLFLFIKKNYQYNEAVSFGKSCIKSFINSVDYSLCSADYDFGNVRFSVCSPYGDDMIKDMDWMRILGYDVNYNYVGDDK